MTLPTFLGIGAMRSGTTWLDQVLRSHPDIYMSERRKEIHFFDQYYERGLNWYQDFFPNAKAAANYQAIGEITPKYLFVQRAPALIKKDLPGCKFIIILRNPADRAYSHYNLRVKKFGEKRPFEAFLSENSDAFGKGLYAKQLDQYLAHFPLEQFLILIFEETIASPETSLAKIAEFLAVDPERFNREKLYKKENSSGAVRYPLVWKSLMRVANFIRNQELDWLWHFAKKTGVKQLFEKKQSLPPLDTAMRDRLLARYETDISQLASTTGLDLSIWQ